MRRQLESIAKVGVIGIGVGIGLVIAAPFIGGGSGERRRIAKGLVHTWYGAREALREKAAEAGERLSDLAAEVRAEREAHRLAARATRHAPALDAS